MFVPTNEFHNELIKILNRQYPNHHFDGSVADFVGQALERSGFRMLPPGNFLPDMDGVDLTKQVLYDAIVREPEAFLDAMPELIKTIFKACNHLSHNDQARLALDITNELALTHQVDTWQYGTDAVSEAEHRGSD